MLCVVNEVTQRVFAERQLAKLRDLGTRLAGASTRAAVMAAFEACFSEDSPDLPFVLAYLREGANAAPKLAAFHGLQKSNPLTATSYWLGNRRSLPSFGDAFYDVVGIAPHSRQEGGRGPTARS